MAFLSLFRCAARFGAVSVAAALWLLGAPVQAAPGTDAASVEADSLTMVNIRRAQAGLPAWGLNAQLQSAARGHSNYLALNNLTGHNQNASQFPNGFTGVRFDDRMRAAGYALVAGGENISSGRGDGLTAIDGLMAAIYHRFGLLNSRTNEVGTGAATNHPTFGLTLTLVDGARSRVSAGNDWLGLWPPPGFTQTPLSFDSDTESPDPVPDRNTVGYPISLQIDGGRNLVTLGFTVADSSGRELAGRILTRASDAFTPQHASAFIPIDVLQPGQTYTARFRGSADGLPLERTWRFSTPPASAPVLRGLTAVNGTATVGTGQTFELMLEGGTIRRLGQSNATVIVDLAFVGNTGVRVTTAGPGRSTINVTDQLGTVHSITLNIVSGAPAPAPSNNLATSATASGPSSAHNLQLRLQVAQSEVGDLGQVFVVAIAGASVVLMDGNGWQPYNPAAPLPVWLHGPLPSTVLVPVFAGNDVRNQCGTVFFVGYGRDVNDMLARSRFGLAHTLCQ